MLGQGLLQGLKITLKRFADKKVTVQYPEERLPLSKRFRGGTLALDYDKCIACSLCAISCPNKAIALTTAVDENKKKKLTSYVHKTGNCLYCDLCIEACPTKAIVWDKNFEISCYSRDGLDFDAMPKNRPTAKPATAATAPDKGGHNDAV